MKSLKIRQYQSAFVCVGSQCEDPCCSGWNIPISKTDQKRLKGILSEDEFEGFVDDAKIVQVQKKGKSCIQLCSNGLCSLQKKHGHDALPEVCASYPRFMGVHQEGAELGGWLSCPEIVRLTLKYPQTLSTSQSDERAIQEIDISKPQSLYEQSFLEVRRHVEQHWNEHHSSKEFMLSISRLVGLSPAFFHRGAGSFEDLCARSDSNSWTEENQTSDSEEAYEKFITVLRTFLEKKWPYPQPVKLLETALERSVHAGADVPEESMMRYLLHDWNIRWYTHSPNLLFHWQATLFKMLMIRLLYSASQFSDAEERFVQAVYSAERLVEHTPLKRDLYAMFSLPWSFTRWIQATLQRSIQHEPTLNTPKDYMHDG